MPRVIGIDIPDNKRLIIALTYIHGIGLKLSSQILEQLGLDKNMRAHKLTEADIARINEVLQSEQYLVEGDLKRKVKNDIVRLQAIGCYRGQRHKLGLPVRGQSTKKNARTRKGKKKTVAGKKG